MIKRRCVLELDLKGLKSMPGIAVITEDELTDITLCIDERTLDKLSLRTILKDNSAITLHMSDLVKK